MKINKETALEEIRTQFASQFDGLKLEFFKKQHADSSGSPKKSMLDSSLLVSELNPNISERDVSWDKSMTVSELEQLLESRFGLHAQVFRLTGRVWIETTTTDSYTLEKQMSKSADSQTPI
jgi:G3E family GTPase